MNAKKIIIMSFYNIQLTVGIDAISFATSHYYLEAEVLRERLKGEAAKEHRLKGKGQEQIAVTPPDEDIVTLAAKAVASLKNYHAVDLNTIDTLLFATETSFDYAKAVGIYVHQLLNLPQHCSTVEIKQACYGATAAIHMALGLVYQKSDRKVLVIAADISHYPLHTSAELTQGCGAIALLITKNPRLLAIAPQRGLFTEGCADFWRPYYCKEPISKGSISVHQYLTGLTTTWQHYQQQSGLKYTSHQFFCYHTPIPWLAEQAHLQLAQLNGIELSIAQTQEQMAAALYYNKRIGNCYTASLYLSFLSLLDQTLIHSNSSGARIGFYSYGSGCVAEYFSGTLQAGYQEMLKPDDHTTLIANRKKVSYEQYRQWHQFELPQHGQCVWLDKFNKGPFRLAKMENHQRFYSE